MRGIILKSPAEIEAIRRSCAIVARVLRRLGEAVAPGVSTAALEELGRELIAAEGAEPAFLGYMGYPAAICASIDDEVVHGIPSRERVLREGSILSIDVGVRFEGYYGDAAATFPVGRVSRKAQELLEVARGALAAGIEKVRVGGRLYDISAAIQEYAESRGYSVVRDFVGHGIGASMHEEPQVPNFGTAGTGPEIRAGLVVAIEPMVNAGDWAVKVDPDGWTARTRDGSLSAHFEHTVAATEDGPVILTVEDEG